MVAPKVNKIGKYQVLDVIGRGGMGMVYKAVDPTMGRSVAIKTVTGAFSDDPLLLKRFYREAHSTGKLQHVNIVTVYDLGDPAPRATKRFPGIRSPGSGWHIAARAGELSLELRDATSNYLTKRHDDGKSRSNFLNPPPCPAPLARIVGAGTGTLRVLSALVVPLQVQPAEPRCRQPPCACG
jgi:serine/threonine protein kinase